MKTVVIWDCLEAEIRFFVADGDLSRFDGVYVNSCAPSGMEEVEAMQFEALTDDLHNVVYDTEGRYLVEMLPKFPADEVRAGAIVITAGFLP